MERETRKSNQDKTAQFFKAVIAEVAYRRKPSCFSRHTEEEWIRQKILSIFLNNSKIIVREGS